MENYNALDVSPGTELEAVQKEQRIFTRLFLNAPSIIAITKGKQHVFEMANPLYLELIGNKNVIGKRVVDVRPELQEQGFIKLLDQVYATGQPFCANEILIKIDRGNETFTDTYLNLVYQAYKNLDGEIEGVVLFANEVTELVNARKKAEQSEKHYRKIVETAQEGIWLIDKNNITTFVNKKLCEMLEYTEAEMIGKANSFFMDEAGKKIAANAAAARTLGRSEKVDIPFVTKSGKKVWVTLSGSTFVDDDRNYNGGLAMVMDITDRKNTEEKLKQSEKRFRALIENAHDAIVLYDKDLITLYRSSSATRMLGYNDEDRLDKKLNVIIHPEDLKTTEEIIDQVLKTPGTPLNFSIRTKHKAGHYIWIEGVTTNLLHDKSVKAIVSNFRDITDRKKAEEELLKVNERYIAATRATSNAIWDWDLLTDQTFWSEAYQSTFGYDHTNTPEHFKKWADKIYHEDFERVYKGIMKVISENGDYWEDEYRFIKADGAIAYVYDRGNLVYDRDNKPVRFVGAMQDITLRKEIENERELLIKELIKSNAELKQFSYITSHNLRAPLSNITAILDLINYADLDDDNRTMFMMLKESSKQLSSTIEDLSKILVIKNNINVDVAYINVSNVYNEVQKTFLQDLQNIGGNIITDFKVSEVRFHKTYLESIFINLISNAIKYRAPDRKLVLHISTHKDVDDRCILTFSDNGNGIDLSRHKNKVFGLYQRFNNEIEGHGLGLFIVKSQITALGGSIEVESEVNKGTQFIITFARCL